MESVKTALLLSVLLTAGCATNTSLYYWGDYEDMLYDMHINPGSVDPFTQIERLTTDIPQAESEGKPSAPGVHAHLGMAYAANGDMPQARSAFLTEKALFPESAILIDGLIKRSMPEGAQ